MIIINKIKNFMEHEASGGILLIVATFLAMLIENSPANFLYDALLKTSVVIKIGNFEIAKPFLLWINDGMMAIFFFLIGLEIKREFLAGELSDPSRIVLPAISAIGGMLVPALVYASINWGDSTAMRGWAITSATDIAFALGVLTLLGNRISQSLKLFLMTLAIIDDLGAIIIIALFYTAKLSLISLFIAIIAVIALFILNRMGIMSLASYMLIGIVLWVAVLKSGVHATLAGVVTAFFIPFKKEPGESQTQLEKLEHDLHPAVAYGILPLFAFANTGIPFDGITLDSLFHPIPLGIALGLFIGKQLGVFGFCWLAVKMGITKLSQDISWMQLYGVALLCGIGFTMSLFVGSLAFEQGCCIITFDERLGILIGSFISGVLGYFILRFANNDVQI